MCDLESDFICCTEKESCFRGCSIIREILVYFKTLKGIKYAWREKEMSREDVVPYHSSFGGVKKEMNYNVKIVTLRFISNGVEHDKMRYVPSVAKSTKGKLENALIFFSSGGVALDHNYNETGVLFGWEGNLRIQGALKDACKILRDGKIDEIQVEVKLSCPFFNKDKCKGKLIPKVLIEELEWTPSLPKDLKGDWEISRDYRKLTKYISVRNPEAKSPDKNLTPSRTTS